MGTTAMQTTQTCKYGQSLAKCSLAKLCEDCEDSAAVSSDSIVFPVPQHAVVKVRQYPSSTATRATAPVPKIGKLYLVGDYVTVPIPDERLRDCAVGDYVDAKKYLAIVTDIPVGKDKDNKRREHYLLNVLDPVAPKNVVEARTRAIKPARKYKLKNTKKDDGETVYKMHDDEVVLKNMILQPKQFHYSEKDPIVKYHKVYMADKSLTEPTFGYFSTKQLTLQLDSSSEERRRLNSRIERF